MPYRDTANPFSVLRTGGKANIGIPSNAIAAFIWDTPWDRGDDASLMDKVNRSGSVRSREPGRCLYLDKTQTQYININDYFLDRNSTYSVVMYFKVEDNGITGIYPLWESTTGSSNRNGGSISSSTGIVGFGYYNGSSYTGVISNISGYNDGKWHCVVCINNSGTLSLYIDGIDVGTSGTVGNLNSSQSHRLGYFSNGSHYMNGWISNYFVYSDVLSLDEIQEFSNWHLRPWTIPNIPTDNLLLYLPLNGVENDFCLAGYPNTPKNGRINNYTSSMIYTGKDVPFNYENLVGYGQSYQYNGTDNYHTTTLNGADLTSSGEAEFSFTLVGDLVSGGYFSGMQGSTEGKFSFGVNGTGAGPAANKLAMGFQSLVQNNTSQGASNVSAVVGGTYRLKCAWDGANVTFSLDSGSGYSDYRTIAYSGGFEPRDFILGARDSNGTISAYCPFIIHNFVVRNGSGTVIYDLHVDGSGSATNSPTQVKVPVLLTNDVIGIGDTDLVHSGIAPFEAEISGWDGSSNILIEGQSINFNLVSGDPVVEYMDLPTGYTINGDIGSVTIGRDGVNREFAFYIETPTLLRTLSVGNSLTQDFVPHNITDLAIHHISTNTELETIVASPTTNLTGDSHRWDNAVQYTGIDYDVIILQPFTADTPYTATGVSSPTYGGERDAAQEIINSGTDDAIIVIYTGFNRQGDHNVDYSYTGVSGIFEDGDAMVYCPTFFDQLVTEIQTNNPGRDIRFANMLGAMELIYQDIASGSGFYSAWGDLYRDGVHLEYTPDYNHNARRLANSVIKRTLGLPTLDNSIFPFEEMSGAEVTYQDQILDELFG